jgi:hypothetical protein
MIAEFICLLQGSSPLSPHPLLYTLLGYTQSGPIIAGLGLRCLMGRGSSAAIACVVGRSSELTFPPPLQPHVPRPEL